jgi:RNAse (barnase) inhibitor barstar
MGIIVSHRLLSVDVSRPLHVSTGNDECYRDITTVEDSTTAALDRTICLMVYEIDGKQFSTLEEFFAEFNRVVTPGFDLSLSNLDAFDDVLSGGCGTPDGGFTLRWKNHELSRQRLGYAETVRQLEVRLARCHPTNRPQVAQELKQAQAHQGPTVFDWLTEIIHDHGPSGPNASDGVELLLD